MRVATIPEPHEMWDYHCACIEEENRRMEVTHTCEDCGHCSVPPDALTAYGWCEECDDWVYRNDLIAATGCDRWLL